jgi:hypothetical protein
MRKNVTPICPRCGSTTLKSIFLISPSELTRPGAKKLKKQASAHPIAALLLGWQPVNQSVFICMNCDYNGICPEIKVKDIDAFRKEVKKRA